MCLFYYARTQTQHERAPVAPRTIFGYPAHMDSVSKTSQHYLATLAERAKSSRILYSHQSIGLELAELLGDRSHKSLYIKLAKTRDADTLLRLAKSIVELRNVKNPAAYFMTMLGERHTTRTKRSKNT